MSIKLSFLDTNKDYKHGNPTLFKIWCGKKYYIWKSNSVKALMQKVVESQIQKEIQVPKATSIFYKLSQHCKAKKVDVIVVEVLMVASPYNILVAEYDMLQASKKDENCLNMTFSNHDTYPRWIPQDDINAFKTYYTKGKKVGSSDKDKRLRKFLSTKVEKDLLDKIVAYVKKNYK